MDVRFIGFLMYRVELKDLLDHSFSAKGTGVPNVPCGVERPQSLREGRLIPLKRFLMYRVELKVGTAGVGFKFFKFRVPNVPCGVERLRTQTPPGGGTSPVPNVPCGVERKCFFTRE